MMLLPHTVFACLAVALIAMEAPAIEPFEPNYVAVEDVELSTPNGRALGELKKGTLVAARFVLEGVLDVKTADGQFGLAKAGSFSRLGSSIVVTPEAQSVAASSNQFAFDLYRQARQKKGNLFFSPASISTALAMTYAGAAGRTEQEMAAVLHFAPQQNVHTGFATLLELLNSTGDRNGYTLSTANRLWGAANCRFEDAFLQRTRAQYRAPLETLDFSRTEEARTTINAWVADQTRKMIANLIPPGVLKPDSRLVLSNAVYFQGGWAAEFSPGATKDAAFYRMPDDKLDVPTMSQRGTFPYAEDADAQVLSLPYRGHALSMLIVLPKHRDGLATVEEKLTEERFASWVTNLRNDRPVDVFLPKFKLRSQMALGEALKQLGMATAFSADADFSAMSKSAALMISEVIHQAVVEVDEKGTEAAAATAVIMAPMSAAFEKKEPPKPVIFRADHPFAFAIRDNRTGAILFLGRMQQPST